LDNMIDGRTAETCDVYNMIKMARALFSVEPDIRYADFHERALFNHILASQDPNDGRVCYMVPVGRGVQHEYQDKYEDFTCCVGSGMESHALHAYGIYYESGDKLWVSLYAPSTANWQSAGVKLKMSTDFPAGQSASLQITSDTPRKFTLALRRPYWAGTGFSVKVNGELLTNLPKADSYVEINRTWKKEDKVELVLPKTLRTEPLPDNPNRLALMWGPLVLAGDLGEERKKKLGATTLAFAQPGQMQTERDFNQQGEDTYPVQIQGHYGRRRTKWFSFDLPIDTAHPVTLIVTYSNEARRNGAFDILVD